MSCKPTQTCPRRSHHEWVEKAHWALQVGDSLEDPPDFQGGEAAFLQTLQEQGLREKSTSYLLHVSEERARDETRARLPRGQLGHFDSVLVFDLEGPLRLLSGKGGTVAFNKEEMSQRERGSPESQRSPVSLVGDGWRLGLGCGWCLGTPGEDG